MAEAPTEDQRSDIERTAANIASEVFYHQNDAQRRYKLEGLLLAFARAIKRVEP
jgi:hypothetical protein